MKNQYFGDIGDFGKYGLLLSIIDTNLKLGVNWYLTNNDKTTDGSFISYLDNNENHRYRVCDEELFDFLNYCVSNNNREVNMLKELNRFKDTVFYSKILDLTHIAALSPKGREERIKLRTNWFGTSLFALSDCDIIFCDPDNGLAPSSVSIVSKDSVKYIFHDEIIKMNEIGKSIIFYHHRDRSREENYKNKFTTIRAKLGNRAKILVFRFSRYNVRDYVFVLQPEHYELIRNRIDKFLESQWSKLFKYYNLD